MAAIEIGAELDFVDRDEGDIEIARHRLDGRYPVARIRRLDFFFAGDERDPSAPPDRNLIIDLAREQAQRQPDQAGGMRQHALDGEMGLTGIGRPEHSGNADPRGR